MKIKMLVNMAGPEISRNVGDEIEVDDAEAKRLIEASFAIPLAPEPVAETRRSHKAKE